MNLDENDRDNKFKQLSNDKLVKLINSKNAMLRDIKKAKEEYKRRFDN